MSGNNSLGIQESYGGRGTKKANPHSLASGLRITPTQSLAPFTAENGQDDARRMLLIIYIHGFIGIDSSFQGFQ